MSSSFRYVGKRIPKLDAKDKVKGAAVYIQDLELPGMLYGKILYSKYPHARIKRIDTSKAEKLPGVKAVLTGYNTPEVRFGFLRDNMALKKDKVRSLRDEVAAVAAVSEEIAEEALSLIEVEYEELPAVFDPVEAMREDAPLVHEEKGSNILKLPWKFSSGDVDEARKRSKYVVENTFETTWVTHCCMGTYGCVASFDPDGNLTVYSPTQIPFLAQRDFTSCLSQMGLGSKRVRIIQTKVGGAFGNKLDTYAYEYIAILLSYYTGRPVKIVFTREEEFFATSPRQPSITTVVQGCDENGKLTFREVRMILDNGAYTSWGATTPTVMVLPISSLYRVPNVYYEATCVYTNNTYSQAFRGYGNPQATFAVESSMDILAEEAGFDPLEFRLINANEPGETTPQKLKITTCGLKECIEKVAEEIGWKEKRSKGRNSGRGVGIACLIHVGGGARIYRSDGCGTIIKVDDFGNVDVMTGATDIGQGADTVIAQVVAEELGVDMNKVNVVWNDTAVCPWDVGVHASRTTFIACNSAIGAVKKLKAVMAEYGARIFGCSPEDVEIKNGMVYPKNEPEKGMDFAKFARKVHFREDGYVLAADYFYDPPNEMYDENMKGNLSVTYTFGAHGVEVEVDKGTGKVKIIKYVACHDVGKCINPLLLEGQVQGGAITGVGYALSEELVSDKGKIVNTTFLDYKMPSILDIPDEFVTHFVETNDENGPFGAKGIGEPGLVPTAPAIANAIYDATGIRLTKLPMTGERLILEVMKDG